MSVGHERRPPCAKNASGWRRSVINTSPFGDSGRAARRNLSGPVAYLTQTFPTRICTGKSGKSDGGVPGVPGIRNPTRAVLPGPGKTVNSEVDTLPAKLKNIFEPATPGR